MLREFTTDDAGKYTARLTTVIDCWTDKEWEKNVFISFQLADFWVQPQDSSLPVYRKFAKFKWWWVLQYTDRTEWRIKIDSILDALGYDDGDVLEFLLAKAWAFIILNVSCNSYRWVVSPIIEDYWHEEWSDPSIDRWVDVKTFKFTEDTTLQEIKDLWFDEKHVKKSEEYKELYEREIDNDSIEGLF